MSQVSMQNRATSTIQSAGWGSQPNGLSSPGQAVHLPGLNATPWQTGPAPQWGLPAPQPGMPTLRAIMQEEQQAALQGRAAISHTTGSINASRNGSAGDTGQLPPPMNMAQHHPVHQQQQQMQQQQHQQQMQHPQQQYPQQQQQPQRSGGFYMRNKRDDSVPVKGSWAQALNRPPVEAPSNPPGVVGFGNGMVDLQMATEAFRDAFSATAPSMEGPLERDQDPLLAEAYKSQANPITGNVHCLGCGKAFKEHSVLGQHLKDKHQGRNTADASNARGNLTLGDIMAQAQAKRAAVPSQAAAAAERHQKQYSAFTPGDSRGMREYLKRFPNKASLAMAVHKELGGSHTKKKMSRLKRIILRERADKAAAQAGTAAEQAAEGLVKSKSALESLQKQLKEAEEQLDEGQVGFIPEASAMTHKQVLEMAVAEASRRVHEATKQVTDAEEEAAKKADERAKVWKTHNGSNSTSPNTTPSTSVEIVPKDSQAGTTGQKEQPASSSKAERSHSADEAAAAVKAQMLPSADDQYVSEQLQLMGLSLKHEAQLSADEEFGAEAGSSSSGGDHEEEWGLEAFEDVLSSWLTAAHSKTSQALMKAQASLPLRPRTAGNPSGSQSTLDRIQEQQQQLLQEEAKAEKPKKIKVASSKQAAHVDLTPADEDEEEEPDSPSGLEGWKDVLSGWMDTAGVSAPAQHAQHADSNLAPQAGAQGSSKKSATLDTANEAPGWLADVSSDEEDEAEEKKDSVVPPRTSSISESQLKTAASQEGLSDTERQAAQPSTVNLNSAGQQLPQQAQHAGLPHAPFPPSPLQGYSVPFDSVMSTSGISSQDRRLEGDLLSRARSDPAALWPNSASGFPPRAGLEHHGLAPVATSVPTSVYPADQGLPAQALQNWKEQFNGLYRSFGADQPGPAFATVPNPAFAGHRFEPPSGSTANSHEFECAVCSVTCCGIINFEQHCTSKKHLRKAAAVAHAAVSSNSLFLAGNDATPTASTASDGGTGTTYVGIKAQCRTYCKQVISAELNRVVVELLQQLLFWQERQKAQDPLKATKKKRLVSGLREVAKAVKLHKAKTVVVAPNIEQIESEGGLDDLLGSILKQAEDFGLPVVFALSRKKMGQVFGCRKKMSAIAILDYGGANELFHQMSALAKKGRVDYMLYYKEDESNAISEMDPMALTRSDSDSSSILGQDIPAPILYRLRADGRKVPITDGQGMDLARRKGLIQEVIVSPKRASKTLADANSAFGPQLSQPETVVLHSVELPQVQLGDREIADSPPEKAGDEAAPLRGVDLPKPLDLRSHPSLLQLQQQQQQPQTNSLMTKCGLEPRSNSETVWPTSRGSPDLTGISQSMSMSRIGSMNRLAAEVATAGEMAGNRLGSATPSVATASQQPGYMHYWGPTNNSALLPHQAMPLGVTSRNPSLEPSGTSLYVGASAVGAPFAHTSLQRESLSQHLARASPSLGARPPGPAAAVFPAASQDGRTPPGSSMHGSHFGAQMPHLGGNRFPARETVGAQDLGAFNAASTPTGRAFRSAPGPAPHSALPNALGPADPSVLFNDWQGLGGKPAPPPAAPMGYGAYALSEQHMSYGSGAAYPGQHVEPPPLVSHPWQQAQLGAWPPHAQHMNPYPQAVGGMPPPYHQQQQQQHMLNNAPRQLNAHAQEWKPRWA
ncbi:TPA: Selenocysteine insertion sequence-binding protein 2 [Trebouxia sp. C0005]